MFIKLTSQKTYKGGGDPIYLNPLTITGMCANGLWTNVYTINDEWYVEETPEEIMKAIEGKVIIHARETECEEVKD